LLEDNSLNYINYQRLLLSPTATIDMINQDNQPINTWDEEVITNSEGEKFKQVGFLSIIPQNQTSKLVIQLDQDTTAVDTLLIQKQPGLPPTPYTIKYNGQELRFNLSQDTILNLTNLSNRLVAK